MRIERESGYEVGSVWTVFTPEEARDLIDTLASYFADRSTQTGLAAPHRRRRFATHGRDPRYGLRAVIEPQLVL
jgi:hypothetical protein